MALAPLQPTDPPNCGPYRLQGRLGAGGMGVVYLAFGPDDAPVALKVLQPVLARDEEYRIRFVREVSAARLVASPHVARVVAAETGADRLWMATEYVEGATLADAIESNGPVPADRLRGLASDLAGALSALHAVGLVHRDLKPANVVLAWSGPKLIDFGVAKHEGSTGLTQTGVTIGSQMWLSPEVLNGYPAARSSDIFAWGMCVAFAGTGRLPFGADDPNSVGYRICYEQPDLRGLPREVMGLVGGALAKDPAARPTADALCAALGPPVPPPPVPAAARRRGIVMPVAAIAALLLVAAIAVAILATGGGGKPKPPLPQPSTSPSASASSSPTPSPPSSTSDTAANEASALATLLSDSARSRADVVAAVASTSSCSDPATAALTLTKAASARAAELERLAGLDLSALDTSGRLVPALTAALTASRNADISFAAWATAAMGCSGSAPHDANYEAASSSSVAATASKQEFVDLWTPIARQYGLPARRVSDI